ncbi:MAG: PepSY-associated TM helix domain-containing protein [Acetobacter sp.]|uniref:PepSY-associated TM helix domain-containing protein n=1 Tax=Acetobacter sp. TaxID=440 RepID=UPI0039ED1225
MTPPHKQSVPSLRMRMGWLHAWVGFIAGLLLVCIFVTGTMSVFDTELTHWMQPETPYAQPGIPSAEALDKAAAAVTAQEGKKNRIFLSLPSDRDPLLHVTYMDHDVFKSETFHPQTGQSVPLRETVGGLFFFSFHYTLYMGRMFGVIFVQVLAVGMLVTLGSGVIIHLKALLPNLVAFRPQSSSPRPWIDAHVIAAVLFLPFMFMIAYTGVLIHANRFFPNTAIERPNRDGPGRNSHHQIPSLPPLAPLLADAAETFGADRLGFIQFSPKTVTVVRADNTKIGISRDHIDYDRVTGERIGLVSKNSPAARTSQFLSGLHMARWAPVPMRWLYFISGCAGYVMFATGLVMFLIKRRRTATQKNSLPMEIAEGLALGTVLGMPLACAGVLWMNRLLPADLPTRVTIEGSTLFVLWGALTVHALGRAFGRKVMKGWIEQSSLLSLLLCLLPVLDLATRWKWIAGQDQTVYAAVDLTAVVLGLLALRLSVVLRRKTGATASLSGPSFSKEIVS